jgi:hypothetical protein
VRYDHISSLPSSTPAGGRATAHTGEVSVIPQPWTMSIPWRSSRPCISPCGTAAPPHTTTRSEEVSTSLSSRYWSTALHTVGTPAEQVTFSLSISRASGSPCRKRSGMTSEAPVIPAPKGMPHAFTWNSGTIGSTRSEKRRPSASGELCENAWRIVERCE